MAHLTRSQLTEPSWPPAIARPQYAADTLPDRTQEAPEWLHIGPGNIFRGYIAAIQDTLLNQGDSATGIIALSTSDAEKLTILRDRWEMLTVQIVQGADTEPEARVIASVTEGLAAQTPEDWARACDSVAAPSMKLISFTITEKGYRLTDADIEALSEGPAHPRHAMAIATALLLARFTAGGAPIALVSFDNFTHNGDQIRRVVTQIADCWIASEHAPPAFRTWLDAPDTVTFPLTVIDRIVPRANPTHAAWLRDQGLTDVGPVVTAKGQDIAAYVNTEDAHYLLIEDSFPNGRPPFDAAGVHMTDRGTVDRFEGMKVNTCLNPLHTALAITGCLLGHPTIADCMADDDLDHLVRMIGYVEGLPVTQDPGIIDPERFLTTVIEDRLPNPHTGDTPQRIATDTSQKIAIRFGETLKKYALRPELDPTNLHAIPLTLALWIRYLLAVDDTGTPFTPSPDPQLESLTQQLSPLTLGTRDTAQIEGTVRPLLQNAMLFGLDLVDAGLAPPIQGAVTALIQGPGAVRRTLQTFRQTHPLPPHHTSKGHSHGL